MDQEAELIREQMQETRAALTDKLEALEHQVTDTVQTAATSVAETVETVTDTVKSTAQTFKDSVEGAMESVGSLLDLRQQVERHPWGMLAAGVAVGFIGTRLFDRSAGRRATRSIATETPAPRRQSGSSLLGWLTTAYDSEVSALKAVAIGTAAGIVRDMIAQSLPKDLGAEVSAWIDNVTTKVGGRPIRGPILERFPSHDNESGNGSSNGGHGRF